MACAARLPRELLTERGARALTHIVNLIEAPSDRATVVLAGFVEVSAVVGATLSFAPRTKGDAER